MTENKRIVCKEPVAVRGKEIGGEKFLTCMPLVAEDYAGLIKDAGITAKFKPDLIEWRADYIKQLDSFGMVTALNALREAVGDIPIIFTIRNKKNKGQFEGDEELRSELFTQAIESGLIDIVDIEVDNDPQFNLTVMSYAAARDVATILSYHDFEKTATENDIYKKLALMADTGADIVKYAAMPNSFDDVVHLLSATKRAREGGIDIPMICISMGELGRITRITGGLYGSDVTYINCTGESGPGQISVRDIKSLIDLKGEE